MTLVRTTTTSMRPLPLRKASIAALTKIFEAQQQEKKAIDDDDVVVVDHRPSRNDKVLQENDGVEKKRGGPSKGASRLKLSLPLYKSRRSNTAPPPLALSSTSRASTPSYSKPVHRRRVRRSTKRGLLRSSMEQPRRRHVNRLTFPVKLFQLLESRKYPKAISWSRDGKAVVIHSRPHLQAIFKADNTGFGAMSSVRSFHRQLSLWCFTRRKGGMVNLGSTSTPSEEGTKGSKRSWKPELWEHPYFYRGMSADSILNVERSNTTRSSSSSGTLQNHKALPPTSSTTTTTTTAFTMTPAPVTPEVMDKPAVALLPETDGGVPRSSKTTTLHQKTGVHKAKKNNKSSTKKSPAVVFPCTTSKWALTDHRPSLPYLLRDGNDGEEEDEDDVAASLPPRRISFQDSDFGRALANVEAPPSLDWADSTFSVLSFLGGGGGDYQYAPCDMNTLMEDQGVHHETTTTTMMMTDHVMLYLHQQPNQDDADLAAEYDFRDLGLIEEV